jgi:hypothetical protein
MPKNRITSRRAKREAAAAAANAITVCAQCGAVGTTNDLQQCPVCAEAAEVERQAHPTPPESCTRYRSDLTNYELDTLADLAAVSVAACFVKGAKREKCIETVAELRTLASMVEHRDPVLAATSLGAAESIETMIGAAERAS